MKNYTLSPTYLLRTPLLSLNRALAEVWASNDLSTLKSVYQQPLLQEALFLASPVLYEQNQKWQRGEVTGSEEQHLAQGLWRYLLRMSSRCTPFGLFAGVTMGEWSSATQVTLHSDTRQAHTRLDMEYLGALAQHLAQLPELQARLRFYPNNSLYSSGEQLRYVDYQYRDKRRVHQIVAIDNSEYVEAILARAAQGGALPSELAALLVSEEIREEEAQAFIEEMIAAQVLISALDGRTTATVAYPSQVETTAILLDLVALCDDTALRDHIHFILEAAHYQFPPSAHFKAALDAIGVPYDLGRLFQTDLAKSASACALDKKIAGSLRRGLSICNRLSTRPSETNLSKFASAFSERYEGRELPLLQVLDIETGIGYLQRGDSNQGDINPLVDDLHLSGTMGDQKIDWNTRQAFLFQKLLAAQQSNAYEVTLDFKEIEQFEETWDDVSPSVSVMFSVLEQKEGEKLPKVIFENAGGNATRLLGRFTTMDAAIHQWCSDIAAAEQATLPETSILAEIVHLPENRTGNILMRTTFRPYEIPYLAQSSVAEEFQIPLQDLWLSVRGNELVLRSKRLGKRVLPVMGNAHNYSFNALPVYHFLCDLQHQNQRSGFGFHWGNLASSFRFLPRVCHENLILHRATWQLQKADIEVITKSKPNELMQNVRTWQTLWRLPNRILIVQGDNELLIDLTHELSVKTLVQEIKNSPSVTFAEFLFSSEQSLIQDEKGENYTNECIAVFLKEALKKEEIILQTSRVLETRAVFTPQRSFALGSEWVYFKVYCGAATADELLCKHIYPLVQVFLENEVIDQWFFIRYADPKAHIRIRFRASPKSPPKEGTYQDALGVVSFSSPSGRSGGALGYLIQSFHNALAIPLQQGKVWKLQADTYEREIERYGATTMELSEQLFCLDSSSTLEFLSNLEHFNSEYRWLYAILAIDTLLDAFEFSLERKTKLLEHLKTSFGKEFGMNKHLRKQLNEKYSKYETQLFQLFDSQTDDENIQFVQSSALLNVPKLQSIALSIKDLCNDNEARENDLLGSYIHMTLNRLFKAKQRMYEMVVYDFAFKRYQREGYHYKIVN